MHFKRVLFAPILLILPFAALCQNELGLRFGLSNYLGDLAPSIIPSESRPTGSVFYRYNYSSKWKFRTSVTFGYVGGNDRNFEQNELRNLSFRSSIWELELVAEYHLLPFIPGMSKITFSPYIMGGIAGFRYQPQAYSDGTWLNLRGLGTEGQTTPGSGLTPYSEYSISFPIGIGFKKTLTDLITFGMELSYRYTLTDYLDDVSRYYADPASFENTNGGIAGAKLSDRTPELGLDPNEVGSLRGNPDDNDKYIMLMFSISKRLGYAPCYTF